MMILKFGDQTNWNSGNEKLNKLKNTVEILSISFDQTEVQISRFETM
jgi:hypothetical protein